MTARTIAAELELHTLSGLADLIEANASIVRADRGRRHSSAEARIARLMVSHLQVVEASMRRFTAALAEEQVATLAAEEDEAA